MQAHNVGCPAEASHVLAFAASMNSWLISSFLLLGINQAAVTSLFSCRNSEVSVTLPNAARILPKELTSLFAVWRGWGWVLKFYFEVLLIFIIFFL